MKVKKFVILIGASFGSAQQAHAADHDMPTSKPVIEDDERILDGLAIAPVRLDASLAGFDLELDTSVVREARLPSVAAPSYISFNDTASNARPARLTDMRLSVRKSVPLTKKLVVDMLFRAEVPTGNVAAGFGRGRSELMADVGLRAELKPLSIWAGGARRFSKANRWSPGRDVNEIYGGWNMRVDKKSELRMDFVSTGKRSATLAREWSISTEYGRSMGKSGPIAVYAGKYAGPWGKDLNAGVTVRFKL